MFSYIDFGKGFGFWKTMPTWVLKSSTRKFRSKIFLFLYLISPVVRTPGTSSTMRFNVLIYVDFPQPDGPMTAVTSFSLIDRLISFNAWVSEYHKFNWFVSNTARFFSCRPVFLTT